MTICTKTNTFEGAACPWPRERRKREKRVSFSGFAKRVWKSDGARLTNLSTGTSWSRIRLFN